VRLLSFGSERMRQAITGLVGITVAVSLATIGVQYSFGYYDDDYRLNGSFAAAGQGLQSGSDIKIRGVNIGKVAGVELRDGRAWVSMDIDGGEEVPRSAEAIVRPKTLFGEKFIDIVPGEGEASGPFYEPGEQIEKTLGGFELERVLADLYPILKAVDPAELVVVLGELADAGDGLGPVINRSIVNFATLADLYARHADDVGRTLDDIAAVTETLDGRADDLVRASEDLNIALPVLNQRDDELAVILDQTARLSSDLAELFEANREFIRTSFDEGARGLSALNQDRAKIRPVVDALRRYVQTVAESISLDVGDGTLMARVRAILGGDPCGQGTGVSCLVPQGGPPALPGLPTLPPLPTPPVPLPPVTIPPIVGGTSVPVTVPPLPGVGQSTSNGEAVNQLIGGLLG
jgi:phospholipid/cholesterol/gamma-HCH transport system substrate-binding protein